MSAAKAKSTPKSKSTAVAKQEPISESEERTLAMLAHLSVLLNLITGFLGPIVALLIYILYKDRSEYVAFQSLQAFIFQLITWVFAGIIIALVWVVTGLLSIVLIGLCLIPVACAITLLPLFGLVYGTYAGIETGQGKDFHYWLVGGWTETIRYN